MDMRGNENKEEQRTPKNLTNKKTKIFISNINKAVADFSPCAVLNFEFVV